MDLHRRHKVVAVDETVSVVRTEAADQTAWGHPATILEILAGCCTDATTWTVEMGAEARPLQLGDGGRRRWSCRGASHRRGRRRCRTDDHRSVRPPRRSSRGRPPRRGGGRCHGSNDNRLGQGRRNDVDRWLRDAIDIRYRVNLALMFPDNSAQPGPLRVRPIPRQLKT
jgi:hypothetical protein